LPEASPGCVMNWLKQTLLSPRSRFPAWLWVFSLFLTSLGARLWFIHRYGTPFPIWDQWLEAFGVYVPYSEGRLSVPDLFLSHNEHRIVFTRVYTLVLWLLNHQWDNQLEMVTNAIIHCATLAGLGWLLSRWLDRRFWMLVWAPLVLVLALPFGWENSLAGFQSQFYFLLACSLLTLWLLGLSAPQSPGWWCGAAVAVMALFTVASGFLAAAAVFALVVLRLARKPVGWKRELPTMVYCAALILAGLLLKADVRYHHALQAHSIAEFLVALGNNLAWPWIVIPPFALLNLFPLAVLAWCYLRRPTDDDRPEEMTLALGIWAILQGAAAAYARGAEGKPPGWRYMDSSSFILVADCFAIAVVLNRHWPALKALAGASPVWNPKWPASQTIWRLIRAARPCCSAAFILWGIACATGLALLSWRAWRVDIPERQLIQRAQLQYARAFMATDDPHVFDGAPKSELTLYQGDPDGAKPAYEAELLVRALRDPRIRNMLPACVRPPLELKVDPGATRGFVTNGFHLARREPPTEVSWGSYTSSGPTQTGAFESLPVPPGHFPYLEIPVAGSPGTPGLSLELVEVATGKRLPVSAGKVPGEEWHNCYVRAPAGEYRIVARDGSESGWLAFKAPREVGRLSYWSTKLLRAWPYLLLSGLALLVCYFALKRAGDPAGEPSGAAKKLPSR
jgi:hypothetical protein